MKKPVIELTLVSYLCTPQGTPALGLNLRRPEGTPFLIPFQYVVELLHHHASQTVTRTTRVTNSEQTAVPLLGDLFRIMAAFRLRPFLVFECRD